MEARGTANLRRIQGCGPVSWFLVSLLVNGALHCGTCHMRLTGEHPSSL